jgi:hypothetical protein
MFNSGVRDADPATNEASRTARDKHNGGNRARALRSTKPSNRSGRDKQKQKRNRIVT